MATDPHTDFTARMHELRDLQGVIGILGWDQETMMPAKGGDARARQLSTLQGLYHERLTAPGLGEALAGLAARGDLDEATRAMVRNIAWERDRALKVPSRLVKELAERQSRSVEAWRGAKKANDFAAFRPHLEGLVRLKREQADALGHGGERYDALLEAFEPGMRTARLTPLFQALREKLVPLVRAIVESGRRPPNPFAGKPFDEDRQWTFTMRVLQDMGFDLEAGRQDRSTHPFTAGACDAGDVRLTTRLSADLPLSALMSTVHECGHGLYEQGFDPAHARTALAQAPSFGLHESQSRFWENCIGRSLPFWRHFLPILKEHYPAIGEASAEEIYAAANTVEPSLTRVEADEVTYNLHVLLRYELELGILRGELEAADLPAAWNEKMRSYLGVVPPDDALGVMQDIHWAWGEFGYFPTYTIGNLYSAMLLHQIEKEIPALWETVERGDLRVPLAWLREKIHRKGFLFHAEELVRRVTGSGLVHEPFIDYLWAKYRPLYGLA